jgi:hypothetical protein
MVPSVLLRRVALVRIDVSEEPGVSFIKGTKIGELGTTQAATSNRRTLRRKILLLVCELVCFWISDLCKIRFLCTFIHPASDFNNYFRIYQEISQY